MALLDRDANLIVIRVVYDGPPEAGKTTSLRALAGSLGQTVYTPAEHDGRTLFFDWMDYTGGRFEGYQIRCQIVSVPGQRELASRRRHLLSEADVVVYVADSTRGNLDNTMSLLRELPVIVAPTGNAPPIGVILQANKRDLPDAVPLDELRALVGAAGLGMGVVESVAAEGTGIRETFVFAVRLALDRVREQLRAQTLPIGRPTIDTHEALLSAMKNADGAQPPQLLPVAPAAPMILQVLAENDDGRELAEFAPWRNNNPRATSATENDAPLPPDASAPSGAIWPPVEGRVILHEASAMLTTTYRLGNGGWAAGLGNGWRAFSSGSAMPPDLESGREMLVRWARMHVACADVLSPGRCIVLAATGNGAWRLWQIVRAERSLRDHLDDIARLPTEEAAARILESATLLCEMSARLQHAPCHVPCSLDTVGRGERGAIYIGLMPSERASTSAHAVEPFGAELESIFTNALYGRRGEVLAAIARAPRRDHATQGAGLLDQLLGHMAAG